MDVLLGKSEGRFGGWVAFLLPPSFERLAKGVFRECRLMVVVGSSRTSLSEISEDS